MAKNIHLKASKSETQKLTLVSKSWKSPWLLVFFWFFPLKSLQNKLIHSHLCSELCHSTFKAAKMAKNGQKCWKRWKNEKNTVNWPFLHQFSPPMAYFQWIIGDIEVLHPFSAFCTQKNWVFGSKRVKFGIFQNFRSCSFLRLWCPYYASPRAGRCLWAERTSRE